MIEANDRRKTTFFDATTPSSEEESHRWLERVISPRPGQEPIDFASKYPEFQGRFLVDEGPMHLTVAKMAPGAQSSRHRHGLDQIVLVTEGALWQGNREFTAGMGFFTPAGTPYAFRVGPEGATIHEFFFGDVSTWASETVEQEGDSEVVG